MEQISITERLRLDWTANNPESKKWLGNLSLKTESGKGEHFLTNFKRFLTSRNGCFDFRNPNEEVCISRLKRRDFRIVIRREKVLKIVKFLNENHCIATKICFGLSKPVQQGGQMQMIVSGTFWESSKNLPESETRDKLFRLNGKIPYYLNFGNQIDDSVFGAYHQNISNEVNVEKAVWGYVMSTKTLLSILTKPSIFGNVKDISFDFGMNYYKYGEEGKGKLLMIKISSPQKPSCVYWLYDTDMPEHDDTTCPPREPCTPPPPPPHGTN